MKRVVVDHFGPEVLRLVQEEDPLRERKIHPVVAGRLALSEARHAHEQPDSSASICKLVLAP